MSIITKTNGKKQEDRQRKASNIAPTHTTPAKSQNTLIALTITHSKSSTEAGGWENIEDVLKTPEGRYKRLNWAELMEELRYDVVSIY